MIISTASSNLNTQFDFFLSLTVCPFWLAKHCHFMEMCMAHDREPSAISLSSASTVPAHGKASIKQQQPTQKVSFVND
jgi:hypothetical protein